MSHPSYVTLHDSDIVLYCQTLCWECVSHVVVAHLVAKQVLSDRCNLTPIDTACTFVCLAGHGNGFHFSSQT